MKFTLLIAGASAITLGENKPLIHPQTGLAITTTGQHWYGQPPLAMAEDEPKVNLNIDSKSFRGPGKLWPLDPSAGPAHKNFPVKFSDEGYSAPEKVHTLSPEVHMEINNISETYLWPRTAFYLQTN
tara:strand:+ start:87 stop:467 length:381 start_codon:yes stop_codon:yes gene_type:complete